MTSGSNAHFPSYLIAANMLNARARTSSARVMEEAAIKKLRAEFSIITNGYSASFNSFPENYSADEVHSAFSTLAKSLPKSNGAALSQKINLNVGIITDLYMFNFYKDVFEKIVYISPSNYEDVFAENIFDIIIYISCWRGIRDDEWRGIKYRDKPAKAFSKILKAGKAQGATTIFQSIEDPSNFENFLPLAKQFDVIFTSDADSINAYRNACGHDAVYYAEYGINPLIHNPVGCRVHVFNAALFAGSWSARYFERCEDMHTIFSSILNCGAPLRIVDRNYNTTTEELKYPEQYRDYVLPSVDHELLQSFHKLFRYNINLNSIKDSSTMCAMRVYELQAMGVGIMSNYARSVFNTFPDIRLVPYSGNLSFDFSREETFDQYKAKIRRLRTVMTDRTAYSVTARLLRNAGIEFPLCDEPRVAIICHALDQDRIQQAYSQTYSFCEVICNFDDASEEDWKKNCFDNDIQYFTWFDNNYDYGPNYIRDMINAFKYTDVAFVTKHAWFSTDGFVDGPQHEFTSTISSRGRTVFSTRSYSPFQLNTIVSHEGVKADNLIGYALDPFEIKSASGDLAYRQKPAVEYILSIIVPVFNNGRFLISKCMDSLIRNRNWEKFQVIIVDDGSTDKDTIEIVKNIDQAHDNVVIHCFQDGGSGTASRARNFGIGLAEAPLISFLDPDNEISSGGYDELISIYEELASEDMQVDFVAGYHVKVEAKSTVIGKHAACRCLKIEDLKEHFLVSGKFPVVPTQPTVIRRRLFNERSLRFIEGAAGQDTLFGWELLCHSRAGVFTDAAHLIYYAQRSGSIVNLVDESYFQKKLILERAQVEFLKREGLFRVYKEVVHKRFRDGWYLPKMSKIGDPGMKARCELILREIDNLYNDDVSILLV